MTTRPDVAIVLERFGSGGVERVACHVANGLNRRGLSVEMVVLEDAGPVRSLLDPGISVRRIATVPGLRRGRRMMAAVPALATYLRRSAPRLFHSPGNHTNGPAALAVRLAGFRGALVPKITNPLLHQWMSRRRRWLRRNFYRWMFRNARRVLVLSPRSADQMAELFGERSAISVVHNPYVSERMLACATDRNPGQPPVILSIGRLSKQKNHALLLRAVARLRDRPWRLRICGTGPEEAALRELADELGIADRVELAGFVADPIPEYLAATVMALSSRWEGLPAVALEAVACGCPVVCTASSPGLVDLMHDLGAHEPVAIGDEVALAEALRAALDGRLPNVPPSAAIPYSIEAACAEHTALFEEILGPGGTDLGAV
ncbi:MAG TPA: glycosyltransferase [Sphingomicrobium sp.]|nr:glycosyltransferase [Sphingomicrobium sp.]